MYIELFTLPESFQQTNLAILNDNAHIRQNIRPSAVRGWTRLYEKEKAYPEYLNFDPTDKHMWTTKKLMV